MADINSIIVKLMSSSNQPLETKEIVELVLKQTKTTRSIVFHRLNVLRGDGKIKGKYVGPGKGVWIWWRNDAFA